MKFGRFLEENKRLRMPSEYAANCIDYTELKHYLKQELLKYQSTASPQDPVLPKQPNHLTADMKQRLGRHQMVTTEFLCRLEHQCDRLNNFYLSECRRLTEQWATRTSVSDDKSECVGLWDDLIRLERFVYMNFTGICKILKKHDRMAEGLVTIRDWFLHRLNCWEFYQSTGGLLELKQQLMADMKVLPSASITPPLSGEQHRGSQTGLVAPQVDADGNLKTEEESQQASITPRPAVQWFPPRALLPSQKVLITLNGPHGTDILGCLVEHLARYNDTIPIEDLMFSRLFHNVTCAVLVRLNTDSAQLFKELGQGARKWEAELKVEVYDERQALPKSLEDAPYQNRAKYTATVLSQSGLSSAILDRWTKLLLRYQISVESIKRLNEGRLCVAEMKLSIPTDVDFDKFRAELFQLSSEMGADIALQPDDVFRKNKRLIVMDMDSTLIQQEVIDELARNAGVVDQVAQITHRAMNGEIDFTESLRQRVGLLKGAPVTILEEVRQRLSFTEGAHFLCKALKKLGFKLAVISGGFLPLALYVKNELGLDYAFANQLKASTDGNMLLGETHGPIVDGQRKAELLEVIAQAESIGPEQVIAIGDGANDLLMLAAAGLGIAFNAKPRVQEKARTRINQKSLLNVLYLLGYSDKDIAQLK